MFNVRAVSLDHYISRPIDELYEKMEQNEVKEWQEPVLRIFGPTANGFKTCVHVHGVYPYIYVPYKGGENAERDVLLLGAALDEALRCTLNAKVLRFVYRVNLVSGIPLYGYHSKHRQFFKIYFYNPFHIKKAFDLLLSGAILGQKFQPHEAHIPYALQFMMDYNIYGMSFVTFSKVKYRRDPENPDFLRGVKEEDLLSDKVKKMTWSRLEVDAWASDIMNRTGQKTVGVNPGLRALWEDEQNRRRAQNRNSQMTLRQSQSRPDPMTHPAEVMYKARLAQKLAEISAVESGTSATSEEPAHSYPAEVPENEDLLEASVVADGTGLPRVEESVGDASGLVDERILTQISGSEKEKAESESEEEMEFDSVLGRNQKLEGEEEAEPEDEEGVDMTQPLEAEDEVICGGDGDRREPGRCGGDGEETFWRGMADKIFQLDGAQESSSESEVEAAPPEGAAVHGVCDGSPEPSSPWSSNIMSILSECSECPTPAASCPTPRTFWFDYSSDLLSQNQDTWISNKGIAYFSEFAAKDQHDYLDSGGFLGGSKDVISGEPYGGLFASNGDDYFLTQLPCDTESAVSPAILTPASEGDGSDVNPFSGNFRSSPKEKRKVPSAGVEFPDSAGKPDTDQQKVLQVLKSFSGGKVASEDDSGHLTLKQYIKDCKEIVSVDFKNLCNREMIVIEYKSQNKRSQRNKYLIKPLDKFLESWNSAERKASDRKEGIEGKRVDTDGEKNLRSNYVINVLEKRFSDASTVQSLSNKLTVKSMEILPDGGSGKNRCYNVNENIISSGEIKMKLMKSQKEKVGKNLAGGSPTRRRNGKCRRSDERSEKTRKKGKDMRGGGRENVQDEHQKVGKCRKWNHFPEPDTKLINEINSSFEEYFKSIVKRKNLYRKRRKNIIGKMNRNEVEEGDDDDDDDEGEGKEVKEEDEEEKEETSEDERMSAWPTGKRGAQEICASSNADPIKFVTRFLSTFSRMSDVPPLSITIRLGNSRASVPVKVNLRPPESGPEKGVKRRGKQHGRKSKIENVDGPADDSSSEESASADLDRRPLGRSKSRRDGRYEPLDVVVYGSPQEKKRTGGKRKAAACESAGEAEEAATTGSKARKSFPVHPPDRSGICREKPKSWPPRGGKQKISSRSLVKKKLPNSSKSSPVKTQDSGTDLGRELDFIADSEEDMKRDGPEFRLEDTKRQKKSLRAMPERIPQADTEAVTTSDDDDDQMRASRGGTIESDRSATESRPEMAEGGELQSGDFGICREPPPLSGEAKDAGGAGPSGSTVSSVSPAISRESKPRSQEEPPPGTSLLTQTSLSPLALSGSPLFASGKDSSGSESPASIRSRGKSSVAGGVRSVEGGEGGEAASSRALRSKILKPKNRAPSRKSVAESARLQGIAGSEKAPFYGDPIDALRASDAGLRMLKIETRSVAGLKAFRSSLGVLGIDERMNASFRGPEMLRWHFAGNEEATITPLMKPPSRETVWKCLRAKIDSEDTGRAHEKAKLMMMQPLSPGQEMESEEEVDFSLTMSSFSPVEDICRIPPKAAGTMDAVEAGRTSEIKGGRRHSSAKTSVEAPEDGRSKDAFRRRSVSGGSDPSAKGKKRSSGDDESFRIRGVTLEDTFGFSRSIENVKLSDAHQYMSVLAMEVHVQTREDLLPDPEHDPIRALFYAMSFDDPARSRVVGSVIVGEEPLLGTALDGRSVHRVPTEKALAEKFVTLVREWDPEILTGYETEMHSWGYLVQRGFALKMDLLLLLGRVRYEESAKKSPPHPPRAEDDDYDVPRSVRHLKISGRIVLDAWRVLRHEVALTSYTFENVMYHLSHERHPLLSHETLCRYWEHPGGVFRHLVVEHFVVRILGLLDILDRLDFVNRTSELSRLFGIQFYEVLSRGSQFRVESMMLRLAKPLNYVPASPSVSQRASMRAPASLPLILEPESLFYADPVVVLDFQSLYPSIIIAYNYCFSTCLGRVEKLGGRAPFEFGCTQLQVSPEEVKKLEDDLTISPAGIAFVKSNVRKGILPAMLEEILETRLMVKKSMKENKENKVLQKVLFARQLGLKLIANVTYGYTAANFSGRMPCIEVGDSVVSKGRETLHRAIQLVKNTTAWGARVVYGDTDSIFVLTPGRSREEAFKIGAEIAEAVTQDNPKPVKLKLEKVYQPSILQTKKRYVGYMFESPDQKKPAFEAKGIETVRRDGCPAVRKILEKALRILFDTRDVSLVKKYTTRQFTKLYQGRVNIQDLIFAKEYRGRKGYRPGACVPALQLAKRWTQHDKRAEPRVKERVPYVIVNGPPGVPLIRLVRSPAELISDPSLRINAAYYITKAIVPPMQRCFSLLGADVASWYAEMPRKHHKMFKWSSAGGERRNTISQYFAASECIVCSEVTTAPVCEKCEKDPQALAVILQNKIRRWERRRDGLEEICRSCCGRPSELDCISLDCPVLYRKKQLGRGEVERGALCEILTRYL